MSFAAVVTTVRGMHTETRIVPLALPTQWCLVLDEATQAARRMMDRLARR